MWEMGENTPFTRNVGKRSVNYLGTLGNPWEGNDSTAAYLIEIIQGLLKLSPDKAN